MVSNGMYRTIGKSLVMNSQYTVLTLSIDTFIVNCVYQVIEVKADLNNQPVHFGSLKPPHESIFIDLDDSSDKDGNFSIGSNMFDAYG
jgi:hypothetical protein